MFKTGWTAGPMLKLLTFRRGGRTLNEPQKWHKAGSVTWRTLSAAATSGALIVIQGSFSRLANLEH